MTPVGVLESLTDPDRTGVELQVIPSDGEERFMAARSVLTCRLEHAFGQVVSTPQN